MRSRRGVSEIIASLLLLVIVSIAGAMLYTVSLQNISTQQDNLQLDTKIQKTRAMERFEILAVRITNDDHIIITYINYGEVNIDIVSVYLNDAPAEIMVNSGAASKLDIRTLMVAKPSTTSQVYDVRIVSKEGISTATRAQL
jgi:flagellin-like protein